jgi:membrane-associated phospholipid phosphatase
MNRRLLLQSVVVLVLFALWTSVVRTGIAEGSRETAWWVHPFGEWPQDGREVAGTSDIRLSIFATLAPNDEASATPETIPDVVGNPVIGTDVDYSDSQTINGSRFTTGARGGAVTSMSAFVAGPTDESPNDLFQLAIYEDSGGAPGDRVAATASAELMPDAWNTVAVHAVLQPRTSYWLMYNTNGTSPALNNVTYTPVTGAPLDSFIRPTSIRKEPTRGMQLADRITGVGDFRPMLVAMILISLLAAWKRRRAGIVLLAGFVVALLIAGLLRETSFLPYGSYPSGHALRTAYVAVALCFVVRARGVRIAAGLFVALVCLAAVYAFGHYAEEVIGGLLLGWGIAAIAVAFAGDPEGSRSDPAPSVDRRQPDVDLSPLIDITDTPTPAGPKEGVRPTARD